MKALAVGKTKSSEKQKKGGQHLWVGITSLSAVRGRERVALPQLGQQVLGAGPCCLACTPHAIRLLGPAALHCSVCDRGRAWICCWALEAPADYLPSMP